MNPQSPFDIIQDARSRKQTSFNTLRQFVREDAPREATAERCELCSVPLAPDHRHLLEMDTRQAVCSCTPCALRFHNVVDGRFKLIPRDARALPNFRITDAQWNSLALPIHLAFFFYNSLDEKMTSLYPSPGGATESALPLDAWDALADGVPALEQMEPDVEAFLVNRIDENHEAHAYYRAPIDTCYKLVGLIRMHWQGFSGGQEVWQEIEGFFARLEDTSRPMANSSRPLANSSQPTSHA